MSSGTEPAQSGQTPSTGDTNEAAKNTGGKSPGAGLTNTLGESTEQRVGDAGEIKPESPDMSAKRIKTTQEAFSGGTKPANTDQTQTPAQSETAGDEQMGTSGQ